MLILSYIFTSMTSMMGLCSYMLRDDDAAADDECNFWAYFMRMNMDTIGVGRRNGRRNDLIIYTWMVYK